MRCRNSIYLITGLNRCGTAFGFTGRSALFFFFFFVCFLLFGVGTIGDRAPFRFISSSKSPLTYAYQDDPPAFLSLPSATSRCHFRCAVRKFEKVGFPGLYNATTQTSLSRISPQTNWRLDFISIVPRYVPRIGADHFWELCVNKE